MSASRNVVMTGATSGIGQAAARQIAAMPVVRIILGARHPQSGHPDCLPLDLSALDQVRHFADLAIERLHGEKIDGLVLNAGTNFSADGARTADGYELTFGVNHLAHYLLLRMLEPHLAEGARVVITTSDAHDPAINRMAAPRHADIDRFADPSLDPDRPDGTFKRAMYAYSASKLCNLLTARTFAGLPETRRRGIIVIAYNPGLTLGTRLGRTMPKWQQVLAKVLSVALTPLLRLPSVEVAGGVLAELALGPIKPPQDRVYASLVRRRLTWPEPSELARRDDVGFMVWKKSAKMLHLAEGISE